MASLRIRAAAVADLRGILAYSVETHGWAVAEAYMNTLDRAFDRLREFPEVGQPRFDLRPQLRSLPTGTHRIFYRYDGKQVSIVRVLHQSMDPNRWLL